MHGSPFSVPPLQGLHHDFSSRLLCQSLFQNRKPSLKQMVSSALQSLFFTSDHSRPEWYDVCQLWISGRYDATTVLKLHVTHNYYSTIHSQLLLQRSVCFLPQSLYNPECSLPYAEGDPVRRRVATFTLSFWDGHN